MLNSIGSHFPILVIVCMAIFAATLTGISIEDAFKGRAARRDA